MLQKHPVASGGFFARDIGMLQRVAGVLLDQQRSSKQLSRLLIGADAIELADEPVQAAVRQVMQSSAFLALDSKIQESICRKVAGTPSRLLIGADAIQLANEPVQAAVRQVMQSCFFLQHMAG